MGEILWITLMMWIVACIAFAPLAYFIYIYGIKEGEPFGEIESHNESESSLIKTINNLVNKLKK